MIICQFPYPASKPTCCSLALSKASPDCPTLTFGQLSWCAEQSVHKLQHHHCPRHSISRNYTLLDLSGLKCFCIHNSSQSVTGCCTYISLTRHHIKHQTCLHALAIRIKPQNLETMLLHTPVPIEPCSKTFSLLHLCKADPHPNAWVLHETVPHQLYQHPVSTVAVCYTFLWHTCPTGNKLVVKFSRIFIPFKFNKLS